MADRLQAQIDKELSDKGAKLYFPDGSPKYYTTISIEDWRFHNPITGEVGIGTIAGDVFERVASKQTVITGPTQGKTPEELLQQAAEVVSRKAMVNDFKSKQVTRKITRANIKLPLPLQLVDMHRVKWDEKPIAPWAGILKSLPGIGVGATVGEDVIRGTTGLAPNEFATILFDRPEFKTHELSFKLSPKTANESKMMQKIFITLNNAMSPGMWGANLFFTFPKVINVSFQPSPGFLFKFKPAVIETIATNFAPTGKKAFYHGEYPESMHLTMQIREIEYWINRSKTNLEKDDYNDTHTNG